jgi:hypothetical protein
MQMPIFFLLLFYAWMPILYTNFMRFMDKLKTERASLTLIGDGLGGLAVAIAGRRIVCKIKIYDIRKEEAGRAAREMSAAQCNNKKRALSPANSEEDTKDETLYSNVDSSLCSMSRD